MNEPVLLVLAEDEVDDKCAEEVCEDCDIVWEFVRNLDHKNTTELCAERAEKAVGKSCHRAHDCAVFRGNKVHFHCLKKWACHIHECVAAEEAERHHEDTLCISDGIKERNGDKLTIDSKLDSAEAL